MWEIIIVFIILGFMTFSAIFYFKKKKKGKGCTGHCAGCSYKCHHHEEK